MGFPLTPRSTECILAALVLGGIVVLGWGTTRRRSLKPEGPKIEAEGRGRCGVLGEGAPSPPAKGSGSAVSSPSGVWAEPQPKSNFGIF